jgi:putative ABC transport system permease protein
MLKNYFKVALRNILRNKVYSFIDIAGLSIGLASGFIILLYSINEFSFDGYNKNLDRIYLLTTELSAFTEPEVPFRLGPALRDQYPEVQEFARFDCSRCTMKYKDKTFAGVRFCSADTGLFRILTLPLASGSFQGTFLERNYAVISAHMAQSCFGASNPIGEVITINCFGKSYDLKVTAVMKDIPQASTFRAELILPMFVGKELLSTIWAVPGKEPMESWDMSTVPTYVLLSSPNAADQLERKLADFSKNHSNPNFLIKFHLFPLKDVYFHSASLANNAFPNGDITNLYVYSAIALLTLLIACINFVILSTAKSSVRTKEIGVRKVIGASKVDIIVQMMAESISIAILALPFAFLLVEIFLPPLTQLIGREMYASYFYDWEFILMLFGITVLAGILSGSYVSFYLSDFRPIEVLRDKLTSGGSRPAFRRLLITVQMVIFIGLITASITVNRQLRYLHDKDFGFDKKDLFVLYNDYTPGASKRLGEDFETFKKEIKTSPDVLSVSGGVFVPGNDSRAIVTIPDKSDPNKQIQYETYSVDRDFFETMRTKIVYGKSFAIATPEESQNAIIMNESAVKSFGIIDPSQELFNGSRILGVVEDFNMHSLHEKIVPTVFTNNTDYVNEVAVRIRNSADISKTISFVATESKNFNDGKPMEYQSFDDRLNDLYGDDYKFADMIAYFTALAIFIACLGLFGVSLFVIQRRVKEIGVRRVMGASVGNIFYLVVKEFIGLTLIASMVATPISIYFMNKWLRSYAYAISVDVFEIGSTLLVAMLIVTLTVSFYAVRAATANPVESLRYE